MAEKIFHSSNHYMPLLDHDEESPRRFPGHRRKSGRCAREVGQKYFSILDARLSAANNHSPARSVPISSEKLLVMARKAATHPTQDRGIAQGPLQCRVMTDLALVR